MIKAKTFFTGLGCVAAFAVYLGLSLSCASMKNVQDSASGGASSGASTSASSSSSSTIAASKDSGPEVTVVPYDTKNDWTNWDIELVSKAPCPSRILKITRSDGLVCYAISAPRDTKIVQKVTTNGYVQTKEVDANLVSASEIARDYLINEDDARKAVSFINQLESKFSAERVGDGVLDKFEVTRVINHSKQVVDPASISTTNDKLEDEEYKTVVVSEIVRVFFIQHSTHFGRDEILYSTAPTTIQNGKEVPAPAIAVTLEEILAVRDALSQ